MLKSKRGQLTTISGEIACLSDGNFIQASDSITEKDLENDDWVIVKKQRITIWVPSLLPSAPLVQSPSLRHSKTSSTPVGKRCKSRSAKMKDIQEARNWQNQPFHVVEGAEEVSKAMIVSCTPASAEEHLLCTTPKIAPDHSSPLVGNSVPQLSWRAAMRAYQPLKRLPCPSDRVLEDQNKLSLAFYAASRGRSLPTSNSAKEGINLFGTMSCLNVGEMQNRKRRAMNLERELRRAGGLSRWLLSLGLGQFIQIFQGEKIGKLELVTLTMGKLKDMGAYAVGPRRKLIHAIDRVCRPYHL